ncbi:MAG: RNA polymerase sigma factor RpoD/SigA [Planctomycetaceae bacterium]|jgi:RNA polymerase primary sigma factor|nr:RNA polymerase sigma factor RpoD/SigA [Planctomycetaceae bacterium]
MKNYRHRGEAPLKNYWKSIKDLPTLSQEQETELVKQLETTRCMIRVKLLECDYVVRQAIKKSDETCQSEVQQLILQNHENYRIATSLLYTSEERQTAWKQLGRSRHIVAKLLAARKPFARPEPVLSELENLSRQIDELKEKINEHRLAGDPQSEYQSLINNLRTLLQSTQETPTSLRHRVAAVKSLLMRYNELKQRLAESNLRVVVPLAQKYRGRGISVMDLVQEGNAGLLRAADKFNTHYNVKFITYAAYWMRQAMTRAIAKHSRMVQVPEHIYLGMSKVRSAMKHVTQEQGRVATVAEIAKVTKFSVKHTQNILDAERCTVSLNQSSNSDDRKQLCDILISSSTSYDVPEDDVIAHELQEKINEVTQNLTYREREVIKLRFGLGDGYVYTLDEVGHIFQLSKERIRQIEHETIQKIKKQLIV